MLRPIRALVIAGLLATAACQARATPTGPTPAPTAPPSPAPNPTPPQPAPQPPPQTPAFGAGEHEVGAGIPAGRYVGDPAPGCYWERQPTPGATGAEATAFAFVGYEAAQWIVEILPSDHLFASNAECGGWYTSAWLGAQTTIAPGVWLVGTQVRPGLYRASASPGCYWERLRDFAGTAEGTIASALVSGDPEFVTIVPGDAGFRANGACGVWTPVDGDNTGSARDSAPPLRQAERTRE